MLTGTLPPVYASQKPWSEQVVVEDPDGNPLDLTDCDIRVDLYDGGCGPGRATVTVLMDGLFEFSFASLQRWSAGHYTLACDITRDGTTNPLFRFTVPIISECRR